MTFISFDTLATQTGVPADIFATASRQKKITSETSDGKAGTRIDDKLTAYLEYLESTYGVVHTLPSVDHMSLAPTDPVSVNSFTPVLESSKTETFDIQDLESRLEELITLAMDLYSDVVEANHDR